MKKLFTLLTMLCISTGLWAQSSNYSGIEISFNKSAANVADFMSVTVVVTDFNGNAISNVTAEPVSPSASNLINSSMGGAEALTWTEKVLIGDRYSLNNYNSAQSQDYVFKISGLRTGFAFNKAEVDLYGCNQAGAMVSSNSIAISCSIQTGNAENNLSDFVSSTGNNINGSQEGGLWHKVTTMSRTSSKTVGENEDLYVKVTIQKTNDSGTKCRPSFRTVRLSEDYTNLMKEKIQPFVNEGNTGNGYFQITTQNATSLSAMINEAMSDSYVTSEEYTALNDQLYNNFMRYPTAGYYRIKNNHYNKYMTYGQPSYYSVGLIATSNSDDAASVIKLAGFRGTYKLSVQGLNIQKQRNANTAFPGNTDTGVDFVFNISTPGVVSITNADSRVDTEKDGSLHESNWTVPAIVNWQASSDPSKWVVEDAKSCTVNLNSDGATTPTYYATFCAPFSYTVSEGTKAYTLEKNGNWLIPTEIEGEVAAGTPVLLKGTSATATLTIGSGYAESPLATTALTGTYLPKTITGTTDYVLGRNDGKVGFYHWNSNNLAANRAYLAAESVAEGARGFALMFEDDATGIVAPIGETEEETTIYNLSGQRLNKMQKGINIVNGKKVLF